MEEGKYFFQQISVLYWPLFPNSLRLCLCPDRCESECVCAYECVCASEHVLITRPYALIPKKSAARASDTVFHSFHFLCKHEKPEYTSQFSGPPPMPRHDFGAYSVYCFNLYLTDYILKVILDYTNPHGQRSVQALTNIDSTDLRAYVGVVLHVG